MIPGRVVQIQVFPVKSVPGLVVPLTHVAPAGLHGDRGFVLAAGPTPLQAKHHPRLRDLTLGGTPEAPAVGAPGAEVGDLDAVAAWLGLPEVRLDAVEGGARQVAAVHVVTLRARRVEGAGDSSRANLVLDTDAWPATAGGAGGDLAEGDVVDVGGVRLRLGAAPRHCAGLFAEVLGAGPVATGDPVRRGNGTDGPG